jgi:cysteinyl-tRNA synthetase
MISAIEKLIADGFAYVATDGNVYFDAQSFPSYGAISGNRLDSLKPGHRYEYSEDGAKRFHADWALWKLARDRTEMIWPTPWGDGYPGWHIECSAMSLEYLGHTIDLHVGGIDLRFPHHENERAQAVALGKTFAKHWMHNGFVVDLEGEKMSKSLGNVANLLDLLEHYDARAYRMLLLQTHYRSPVRVGQDNIDACVTALAGLDSFAARTSAHSAGTPDIEVVQNFRTAMDNDLDTTAAMALVFDSVRRANAAMDAGDVATVSSVRAAVIEILGALGLELSIGDDIDADIVAKGVALDAARAAKDFAAADSIRNELQAAGYVVETTKDGTRVRRG